MISLFILQNCHAAAKTAEMAGRHMPHMRFFGTNWWDVKIAFFICAAITIIAVVFIIAYVIHNWKMRNYLLRKADMDMKTIALQAEIEMKKVEQLSNIEKGIEELKAKIEKEKEELKAKIEKEKSELPNVYFKEICNASKNEDGVVNIETVKQLFELYQKNNSSNSES
ncbi:MAG: hypothetical protein J6T38_01125 [Bacteroidaceae bacterium]|nr:hypothetical protein [Bacteroidaceae bacterium]